MLKHALLYAQFGWAVFPVSSNSKIPYKGTHGCKDASKDADKVTEMFNKYPNSNIGIATGIYSGIFVIDIDNKIDGSGEIAIEELEAKYGDLPNTVEQITPSGGRHLIFKSPKGIKITNSTNNLGKYVDIRGDGGYIVVEPSMINGKGYEFLVEQSPFNFDIANAPQWLIGLVQDSKRNYDINLAEKDRILKKGDRNDRIFTIACVARNQGLTDQGSLFAYLQGVNTNNCRPPLADSDVMKVVKSVLSYEDKKAKVVVKGEVLVWDKSKEGAFRTTYRNCINFLKTDDKLEGLFKFNEFSHKIFLTRKPFWRKRGNITNPISDEDVLQVKLHLTSLNFQPNIGILHEAISSVAFTNSYHPVLEYLDSLTWDGVSRVETFFKDFFSSEDTQYTRFISKLLLCAAIKRVRQPGIKYDTMIILEGKQGVGKSRAMSTLGGDWFTEASLTEKDKDLIDKLQGRWIVEVPELDVFKKKEVESLKNFLSTGTDRIRLAYARNTAELPRQCIFVGSINPDGLGYLRDHTGNRRFMPIHCGEVDVKGIEKSRDQLFAEADVMVEQGFDLFLPKDIDKLAMAEQELRLTVDAWETYIERWIEDPHKSPSSNGFTISDVWSHALNGQMDKLNRVEQIRISNILKKLGYENKVVRMDGKSQRVYKKDTVAPVQLVEAEWEE